MFRFRRWQLTPHTWHSTCSARCGVVTVESATMYQVVVLFSADWSDAAQELRELLVSNAVRGRCWIASVDAESQVHPFRVPADPNQMAFHAQPPSRSYLP